jgi:uncharacterized protein YwqG
MPFDFWKRWLAPKQPERNSPVPRDLKALSSHMLRPGVHLVEAKPISSHKSWLGNATEPDAPRNLPLLAYLDLAELQRACPVDWLPSDGALSFYYDIEEQPWGLYPSDRNGFEVVWAPQRTMLPDGPIQPIDFRPIVTYPGFTDLGVTLTGDEFLSYSDLSESVYGGLPKHQIDGWAQPIQDSLEKPEASKLLLQLDSDESLDWMWGDVGSLYFMIQESDARARDFSKAWCVLQCH